MNNTYVAVLLGFAVLLCSCGTPQSASSSGAVSTSPSLGLDAGGTDKTSVELPLLPPAASDAELIKQALNVANEIRRQNKLPELILDDKIANVAQGHAADMVARKFFSHTNPDGLSPFQRMTKAGVQYRAAAENIAYGVREANAVFKMWLDSPGHRRNLLNKDYVRQGIGYVNGYWVHNFAD